MLSLIFPKKPNETRVQTINKELLFTMPQPKTEYLFVLGARSATGDIIKKAIDVYKPDQKVIISGGMSVSEPAVSFMAAIDNVMKVPKGAAKIKKIEADYIQEELLKAGIPAEAIVFLDDKATDTGKNVQNCLDELEKASSVTVVTLAYHQKRALCTLRQHLKTNPILVTAAAYPFALTAYNWMKSKARSIVFGEMSKIDPKHPDNYFDKGFCKKISIPAECARAQALVDGTKVPPKRDLNNNQSL